MGLYLGNQLIPNVGFACGNDGGSGGSTQPEEEWIGDGNTHIWIHLEEGRTSPMLGCYPNGTVTVDWGDGTTPDVLTGTGVTSVQWTPTHNYAAAGDYIITLTVNGTMDFYGSTGTYQYTGILRYSSSADAPNRFYSNAVQKIEIGDGVTSIGGSAFIACQSLANSCYTLVSINIPDGVTSIGDYAFQNCHSLVSINIPDGVTSISTGAFNGCSSLASINIPDVVTSIGGNAFQNCHSLVSINIPDGVTSIGSYAFQNCHSLASINIPYGVTSIGGNTFNGCYSLAKMRFEPTTPPPVTNSNAFKKIPTDCIISVPVGTLAAYTSATNYPDSATYTYIEED